MPRIIRTEKNCVSLGLREGWISRGPGTNEPPPHPEGTEGKGGGQGGGGVEGYIVLIEYK